MLALDLLPLPNLGDLNRFPAVAHAAACTDPVPVPSKSCYPLSLFVVRPYALPTEPLARMRLDWLRRIDINVPKIPVIPPSLGTHCPTIAFDPPNETGAPLVGATASMSQTIVSDHGDACRPRIKTHLTFPCTKIDPQVDLQVGQPADIHWDPPTDEDTADTCLKKILLKVKLPGCGIIENGANVVQMVAGGDPTLIRTLDDTSNSTSCKVRITDVLKIPCIVPSFATTPVSFSGSLVGTGNISVTNSGDNCNRIVTLGLDLNLRGGTTSGPGFVVGTAAAHDPDQSNCCVASYPPGSVVPVVDKAGVLGTAGAQINPATNIIINFSQATLLDGDPVFVNELYAAPDAPLTDPKNWAVFT